MDKIVENLEENNQDQNQAIMSEESDPSGPEEEMSFGELYEESFKPLEEGELLHGVVVQVNKENVMVDIGYKSEGRIPIHEFLDEDGNVSVKVGDEVEVVLERYEGELDDILLSKEKAAKIKVWDEISRIYSEDGLIEGKVIARVKGGLAVDIGVTGFLPGSQVDLRPVKDLESLVGEVFSFKILKYNKRRENVVLSRRAILEDERNALKTNTIASMKEGAVMKGVIKNITDYGAFVDLGGIDGLLHITDMSWGRVGHPSEIFKVGDEIEVKVLRFDRDQERVSLGLKQLQEDPWLQAETLYPLGSKIAGKVVSLTDYGAFVEVQEGIEGLIHVSEMSWTRKIRNPSKLLSVGDLVECKVLSIDSKNKRISLGMKQVEPNPWDIVSEKYPVGTTIEGKIKNITDFGIFIGIDEGIDGLVHVSDVSWIKRIKHPSEIYKKGDEIQAVVLKVDKENERFSLGIKQLEVDPWELIPSRYPTNSRVTGTVTNITDFGLFVELEEGIEGLVHISEVGRVKGKNLRDLYSLGDVISAKVINISVEDRKIGLSVRRMKKDEERSYLDQYTSTSQAATSSLGEQLQQALNRANLNNNLQAEPEEEPAVEEEPLPDEAIPTDEAAPEDEGATAGEADSADETAPVEEDASTDEVTPLEVEESAEEDSPSEAAVSTEDASTGEDDSPVTDQDAEKNPSGM
ncbi:MAG: 30S ribosomal protein S1 [Deltaproteobacteria bacterium]|nr:30S ribosomal protein S1 [Deltaproteobacteria bacterium]MBW2052241.1 30S ribosomal protein S1 [Deltaproteobacteria bacterium]MBW2141693.1 30S ribosomal protein S1 [Deltaproteobacteria bacterium]MBW2322052.1 30S ribosomal protein S1 [Deltaproteobacteria bacterium]